MSARLRHLGLNLAYLTPGETGGTETYVRELVPRLRVLRPDLQITAFVHAEAHEQLRNEQWLEEVKLARMRWGGSRPGWVANEQIELPRLVRRSAVDVCHSPANTGPRSLPCPGVVTVHDLIHRYYPSSHSKLHALGMRILVPLAARHAARVLADSAATAADLTALAGIPANQIDVVPLGVGHSAVEPAPGTIVRERLGLGNAPFVLCVSALRRHKNVERLVEAVARAETKPLLVLLSYAGREERRLQDMAATLGIGDRVRLPGRVEADELESLYREATCLCLPSLYEGFGLPVLEAMARGLPVACSNRASLQEVAGDAALLFDPEDVAAIASSIDRLMSDLALRRSLAEAGMARARRFTWERTAELTLESYERAAA